MASLLRNFWAGALASIVCSAAAAQDGAEPRELLLDSQSLTLDRKTNLISLRRPRITQGTLHIEADEALATGIDFDEKSEWRFVGNVRINVDAAVIEANSAVFTFDGDQLARGELEGSPASFSDTDAERQQPVRGGADKLIYDYTAGTLRLSSNAWVTKDQYEIQGCDLIYDFTDERVSSGSADCRELFRIRVLPQPDKDAPPADSTQ
jgi:lipopolysaccharide transport protein LptA